MLYPPAVSSPALYLLQEHEVVLCSCPFVDFLLVPVDYEGDRISLLALALPPLLAAKGRWPQSNTQQNSSCGGRQQRCGLPVSYPGHPIASCPTPCWSLQHLQDPAGPPRPPSLQPGLNLAPCSAGNCCRAQRASPKRSQFLALSFSRGGIWVLLESPQLPFPQVFASLSAQTFLQASFLLFQPEKLIP